MKMGPGFLSEKIPSREKVTSRSANEGNAASQYAALGSFNSLFAGEESREKTASLVVTEVKGHLYVAALFIICMEVFALANAISPDLRRTPLALSFISFFFFYCVLEYICKFFVRSNAASLFLLLPAILLFFLLRKSEAIPYISYAVAFAAVLRILLGILPYRDTVLLAGIFVIDAAALYLHFEEGALAGGYATDKVLCVILVIMTLAALQKLLIERKNKAFPFHYFVLLGIVLLALPMRREPINWEPALRIGEKFVDGVIDVVDSVSYYMSSFFGGTSYSAEYSSLAINGGSVSKSEKTQLMLSTQEKPYYIYRDENSQKHMKMRRVLYLAGGRGVDGQQLVSFLKFMHDSGVDREQAALFSRVSILNEEYVYLNTADVIAPANSLILSDGEGRIAGGDGVPGGSEKSGAAVENGILGGTGNKRHKKGYKIHATWLDIDYGSPYLIELFRNGQSLRSDGDFSYEDACNYVSELYSISFESILSEEEFKAARKGMNEMASLYEGVSELDSGNGGVSELDSGNGDAVGLVSGDRDAVELPSIYMDISGAGDKMMKLAESITEGAPGDYVKCRFIENYLRQYTYNLDAVGGHDPDSDLTTAEGMADIADRFLFETEEGYCVHYASSMVMLLRLSGIPARVVVGYRYEFPFEEQETYEVSSSCAHAWPEAYIKNVGWVPFEPTASVRVASDFTWHRKDAREEPPSEEYPVSPVPERPEKTGDNTPESPDMIAPLLVRVVLPLVLSVFLLLAALVIGVRVVSRLRYSRGTPEQKLLMDVAAIRRSIKKSSGGFVDRGLMSDYVDRAPEEVRDDLREVFRAYYRVLYGNTEGAGVTARENEAARRVRERLGEKKARQRNDEREAE